MHRLRLAHLAVALAAVALFTATGGAEAAKRLVTGKDIKNGAIGSKQLAKGAVTPVKLSAAATALLTGPAGPAGAPGAPGAAGDRGAKGDTGPAGDPGAFNVVDRSGKRLGRFAGLYSSYVTVLNDEGALLFYDANPMMSAPIPAFGSTLYYKQPNCQGTPYGTLSLYAQSGIITVSAPAPPGSPIWVMDGTKSLESFTSQSNLSSSGCTNAAGGVSQALPAREAGRVPDIQKPLTLVPLS